MNKFDQLVDDLTNNRLSLNQIQIAIRASVRARKNLPEGVKDILCGDATGTGLIGGIFQNIQTAIGGLELAYLRGKQNK